MSTLFELATVNNATRALLVARAICVDNVGYVLVIVSSSQDI
jgi:hypothetical protein